MRIVFQMVSVATMSSVLALGCAKKKDYSGTAKCDMPSTTLSFCTTYNWTAEKQKKDPSDDVNSGLSGVCTTPSEEGATAGTFTAGQACTANTFGSCTRSISGDSWTAAATVYISGEGASADQLKELCTSLEGTYAPSSLAGANANLHPFDRDQSADALFEKASNLDALSSILEGNTEEE